MDAMELDMRMRLVELQVKYREKQRELARLQRRSSSESVLPVFTLQFHRAVAALTYAKLLCIYSVSQKTGHPTPACHFAKC